MSCSGKRTVSISREERCLLISFIKEHKVLADDGSNRTHGLVITQAKQSAWNEIHEAFNSSGHGGPVRSLKLLQTVWNCMRRMAHKELANFRRNSKMTDGGGPPPELSEDTKFIVSFLKDEFAIPKSWYDLEKDLYHKDNGMKTLNPMTVKTGVENFEVGGKRNSVLDFSLPSNDDSSLALNRKRKLYELDYENFYPLRAPPYLNDQFKFLYTEPALRLQHGKNECELNNLETAHSIQMANLEAKRAKIQLEIARQELEMTRQKIKMEEKMMKKKIQTLEMEKQIKSEQLVGNQKQKMEKELELQMEVGKQKVELQTQKVEFLQSSLRQAEEVGQLCTMAAVVTLNSDMSQKRDYE